MGLETKTTVRLDGVLREKVGVHLGSSALRIGGRPSVLVPLAELKGLGVKGGELHFTCAQGEVVIALGDAAERWAKAITSPPSLAKKLGLEAGLAVVVLGGEVPELEAELETCAAKRLTTAKGADLVFLLVGDEASLSRLAAAAKVMKPDGGVWVVRRKGPKAKVPEAAVHAAAKAAELSVVKVAAISETFTADKLVVPRARR